MNIQEYFTHLNHSCQQVLQKSLDSPERFGETHHFSVCLLEFADCINEKSEKELLRVVCSQVDISAFSVSLGLYRQGFSSLRLAFELGLGLIYLSAFKLEQYEWLRGQGDIKWARIIDRENGVLSQRFVLAFFPDLQNEVDEYRQKAELIYRELSEFVHGNYETWAESGLVIQENSSLLNRYFDYFQQIKSVLLFCLCCRYLQSIPEDKIDTMIFINEEMGHVDAIRILIGGPKEM